MLSTILNTTNMNNVNRVNNRDMTISMPNANSVSSISPISANDYNRGIWAICSKDLNNKVKAVLEQSEQLLTHFYKLFLLRT